MKIKPMLSSSFEQAASPSEETYCRGLVTGTAAPPRESGQTQSRTFETDEGSSALGLSGAISPAHTERIILPGHFAARTRVQRPRTLVL